MSDGCRCVMCADREPRARAECECDRLKLATAALVDANAAIDRLREQVQRLREVISEKNQQTIERLTGGA